MKILFINNPHDAQSRSSAEAVLQRLAFSDRVSVLTQQIRPTGVPVLETPLAPFLGELHLVDFMALRDVIPIRAAPSIMLLFDELEGVFPPERVEQIIQTVKSAIQARTIR